MNATHVRPKAGAQTTLAMAVGTYSNHPGTSLDPVIAALLGCAQEGTWSEKVGVEVPGYPHPGSANPLRHVVVLDLPRRRYAVSTSYPHRLLSYSKATAGNWSLDDTDGPAFPAGPDVAVTWADVIAKMLNSAADNIASALPDEATFLRSEARRLP